MPASRAAWLEAWIAAERGRFALWLPVFMGAGVLGYFALRSEPPVWAGASVALPAILGVLLARPWQVPRAVLASLAAAAIGFAAAQLAAVTVAPLDGLPTHAVVLHGTVRGVEAVSAGRRVTLDAVRIDGADATASPAPARAAQGERCDAGDQRGSGQRARPGPGGLAARLSGRVGHAARHLTSPTSPGRATRLDRSSCATTRRWARCSGSCGCASRSTGGSTRS